MKNLSYLFRILSVFFLMLLISACGGSGGDSGNGSGGVDGINPAVPTYQCSHDGEAYVCNDQDSCRKDETSTVTGATTTPTARTVYYAKSVETGGVTIIAECGSTVTFNLSETDNISQTPVPTPVS